MPVIFGNPREREELQNSKRLRRTDDISRVHSLSWKVSRASRKQAEILFAVQFSLVLNLVDAVA